jgi:hypothetical protein
MNKFYGVNDFKYYLRNGQWAILSAENPQARPLSEGKNLIRTMLLREVLINGGFRPIPVIGKYGSLENSFFVPELTVNDARAYRTVFGQESVLVNDGLYFEYFHYTVNLEGIIYDDNLQDNYSEIYINGERIRFQIPIGRHNVLTLE